uniref:Transmembrane protein n=1 Tax=Haemonchus placei TaxID=6290 RepID=A0A0N4WTC2_HAEPC
LLLTIGNLLALAVPITILFIYLFSRKRSQYGSREQVLLLSLDSFHLVAALVLGICTVMLIWNNDNLASIGLQDYSLQERMEEHTRKFMCLVNKSFASAVSSHLPDSNLSRTILKKALMNTLIQNSDYNAYSRNVRRKDTLLGLVARTKLKTADPDPDELQEVNCAFILSSFHFAEDNEVSKAEFILRVPTFDGSQTNQISKTKNLLLSGKSKTSLERVPHPPPG